PLPVQSYQQPLQTPPASRSRSRRAIHDRHQRAIPNTAVGMYSGTDASEWLRDLLKNGVRKRALTSDGACQLARSPAPYRTANGGCIWILASFGASGRAHSIRSSNGADAGSVVGT